MPNNKYLSFKFIVLITFTASAIGGVVTSEEPGIPFFHSS